MITEERINRVSENPFPGKKASLMALEPETVLVRKDEMIEMLKTIEGLKRKLQGYIK